MRSIFNISKYAGIVIVITMLISFLLALFWGVVKAFSAWSEIVSSVGKSETIIMLLIQQIDAFLITIVLYMLAASVYVMFVGPLDLPSWMVAKNLNELKLNLSSVMVLVITVRFLELLFENTHTAQELVLLAGAIAIISLVLIAFGYFRIREEERHES